MEVKTYRRIVLGELGNTGKKPISRNLTREPGIFRWSNCSSVKEEIAKRPVNHYEDPKSPTHLTNLELLTKVASGIASDTDKGTIPEFGDENMNFNDDNSRELETNSKPRKEKSLSILCDKFLKLYPLKLKPGNYIEISLDQATQFIGTDRRRIYDILIVLECLQMASKVEVTEDSISFNEDREDLNVLDPLQINIQTQKVLSNSGAPCKSSLLTGDIQEQKIEDEADIDHKDSSLGIMCQKFLMLFLVKSKSAPMMYRGVLNSQNKLLHVSASYKMLLQQPNMSTSPSSVCSTYCRCEICSVIQFLTLCNKAAASTHQQLVEMYGSEVITLDNAAKILLGSSGVIKDCHKVKTKVRRLYDIANVLSSLELIKKVNAASGGDLSSGSLMRSNKKPAFQYIGPNVEPKPLPDHAKVI
ncbi:hypothetical protein J437_LFUL018507 [Ladona fulva]|uniref:E2F/DP family winged-helix DNA-binding domain-containing protein n=1 Tax=Ladona fulva TaxID=123851 RepID=A0A8K0KRX6_LADFU|nr:hypothetical protein J437_LFUL018507 [Ladona fulva]